MDKKQKIEYIKKILLDEGKKTRKNKLISQSVERTFLKVITTRSKFAEIMMEKIIDLYNNAVIENKKISILGYEKLRKDSENVFIERIALNIQDEENVDENIDPSIKSFIFQNNINFERMLITTRHNFDVFKNPKSTSTFIPLITKYDKNEIDGVNRTALNSLYKIAREELKKIFESNNKSIVKVDWITNKGRKSNNFISNYANDILINPNGRFVMKVIINKLLKIPEQNHLPSDVNNNKLQGSNVYAIEIVKIKR